MPVLASSDTTRPKTPEELLGPDLSAKLDRLDLLSRKMLAGKLPGERRSKRRGRSVEFDDFREYLPGDDLRHLDWNVYARLDRLFIKLFREEEDLALHLLVDASSSMDAGSPSKLVFVHRLAMALAYIGVVNQNRVSVASFSAGGAYRQLAPVRGRGSTRRVADFLLESLAAPSRSGTGDDHLNQAIRTLAQARAGRGIVVVISDFLVSPRFRDNPAEGWRSGLNALAGSSGFAGGFDSYAIQTLAPGELDPTLDAPRGLVGDLRLTDAETGAHAEVTVSSALLARYTTRVNAYVESLKADCAARGIAHSLVPTDTPLDRLLLQTLRRGGMLR